jgi:quercetin dioxygenase-like cupin family protein
MDAGRDPSAVIVGPGEGTVIRGPVGGPLTFKARGEQTGGRLTALENLIPPGEGPPLHRHAHEDETWQVLEGELRFRLGDDISRAPAGTFVFVPRGVPHCFQNVGDAPARILVIFTPAGMERFFDRFAALPEGSDPREAFRSLGAEVGMDVIGPPLAQSHPLDPKVGP